MHPRRIPACLAVAFAAALLASFHATGWAQEREAGDSPRLRWEFFYQKRAFPFDRIPAGALARAQLQAAALRSRFPAAPPPISGTQWQSVGPEGIPISQGSIGRLTAIAAHPTDHNTIYIGGAQGGVWKTTNGGASWAPLTDHECSLAMGALAIDPVNPQIVYAGTGEQHFSGDSYYGCGVLRSTDGGANWTQLGGSIFQTSSGGARIARIVIDPRTAGTVAGTHLVVASDFGLYRSLDGGASFTQVLSGTATDVVMDPTNPDLLYAGVRSVGIYESTDAGASWLAASAGFATSFRRINLAIAPSAPDTLYASAENASGGDLAGIWRTTDAAATWTKLSASGASCGTQCWYDQTIGVAPNDPNTVYFGGVSLYRSIDGGATFSGIASGIHVDQHYIAFDPVDPLTVYVGNDGGIFRSANGGSSWTSLNTNLVLTQFYEGISLHPFDPTQAMGGTQDNGTVAWSASPVWSEVLGGDGGYTAIDPDDPATRYAETQWVASSGYSGPRRSDGGGYPLKVSGINTGDRALFIPPLVMDPTDSRTLYFGTYRVYRSADRADSWTVISGDLTGGGSVSAIAPAAADPSVVYVGTSDGRVWTTTNGGQDWTQRTLPIGSVRYVQDIAVDPRDPQTAWVTVSGFLTAHVFRTIDGGATFQNASGNLPDVPVNAVVADPTSRAVVLVGTDVGAFFSSDSGTTWAPLTNGLPNVAVFDLAYNVNTGVLLAGTHGRGAFTLQLDRPLTLAVVPGARSDTAASGDTDVRADSAVVILSGANGNTAAWSATHGAAGWITLTTSSGTGTSRLRWSRNPTGLAPGVYVDTIRVTVPGAVDSPWNLLDTLVVRSSVTVAFVPASRGDSAPVGSTTAIPDSAAVTLVGVGGDTTTWVTTVAAAPWLTLVTATGTGSGTVRWTNDPAGLAEGTHVAAIVVTPSTGPASMLPDSLLIYRPLALGSSNRSAAAILGAPAPTPDSVSVALRGIGNTTATWTATSNAAWLTLSTAGGTGSGMARWTLDATALQPGSYRDTIVVQTSRGDSAQVSVLFNVTAPTIVTSCAAQELLGTACLDDTGRRYLDLTGNRDGTYNLGDFVALLERTAGAAMAKARR
jgi:photosystem II stability/assembly factor-like uncharacterized protein